MHFLMYCEGGPHLGAGHVLRSLALAEEALRRRHQVSVVAAVTGDFLESQLRSVPIRLLTARTPLSEHVRELAPDVVHVDCYTDPGWVPHLGGPLTSNIEDGQYGRRVADLVVDPTLGAEDDAQNEDLPTLMTLRGVRYAPMRQAVYNRRGHYRARADADRVLVIMGGTDPRGLSPQVVRALAATGLDLSVTVVAPSRLHAACQEAAASMAINLLSDVADLPQLMVSHDVVVSAAGTSVWELCCLGVPMALVCAVPNQSAGYREIIRRDAALGLGSAEIDVRLAKKALTKLLTDAGYRSALAGRAASIADGRGAWRIVTGWEQLISVPPRPPQARQMRVRAATIEDTTLLHRWRNDPVTREYSRNGAVVPLADHERWMRSSVDRDERILLVAADDAGDVGTVRWDRLADDWWEVSITVAPERRGEGAASALLNAGEAELKRRHPGSTATATVHRANEASARIFARAGYLRETDPDPEGFQSYLKRLS